METDRADSIAALVRARQGDKQAFDKLIKQNTQRIYSFCYRFVGDEEGGVQTAEDITQEVVTRVYQGIGGFRADANFTTWMFRIAHNCCVDHKRRTQKQPPQMSIDALTEHKEDGRGAVLFELADTQACPHTQVEADAVFDHLAKEMAPELYKVLVWVYIDGYNYTEVALLIGLRDEYATKEKARLEVSNILRRAKKQARELLSGWGYDPRT